MSDAPKYSEIEIERRWLVDLSAVDLSSAACREIAFGGLSLAERGAPR